MHNTSNQLYQTLFGRVTHKTKVSSLPGLEKTTDSDCPGDADRPILVTSDIDADAGPASLPCDVCAQMEGIDKEPASSYCVVCERKFCAEHLKVC